LRKIDIISQRIIVNIFWVDLFVFCGDNVFNSGFDDLHGMVSFLYVIVDTKSAVKAITHATNLAVDQLDSVRAHIALQFV
jgi:hypothetical protein